MNEFSDWEHVIKAFAYDNEKARKEKEYNKSQRPMNDKKQTTLIEFEEEGKMSGLEVKGMGTRDGVFRMGGTYSKKGKTKDTRGTQFSHAPVQATDTHTITGPTKAPTAQQILDNTDDKMGQKFSRENQKNFNIGPNKTDNMTGLYGKSYDPTMTTRDPDRKDKQGPIGRVAGKLGSIFGFQDDYKVGKNIDTQIMFQDGNPFKKSEPIEVVQCGPKKKKEKFISSEK